MYPNLPFARNHGTTTSGRGFSDADKLAVWQKASPASGFDPSIMRMDSCGALIAWSEYGKTVENGNGWEIDHINPVARGGTDIISNLQALQWQNNREKGDKITANYCLVSRKA